MTTRAMTAVVLLATAVCVLAGPSPAAAQTESTEGVDDATREQARELFRRGRELYQRNRAAEAMELLQQSYELLPSWATSNGMALCADKLGNLAEALRLYERSLAEAGTTISAEQKSQLEQRIGELRRSMSVALLSVVTSPDGAQLSLDGSPRGTTPVTGDIPSGSHTLALTLDGYVATERSITVVAAETRTVDVTLVATAVAPPPEVGETGRLAVGADEDGWAVFVDGTQVGTTPLAATDVAAGERTVRVEGPDRAWEDRVQVPAEQLVRVAVRLGGGGVAQGWFWGIAATAAAAGIGSAATGGYAWSLYDEYQGASPQRRDEIRPTGDTMLDVADALLGVAAGAAVTALVLGFFTDFGGEPEADVAVEAAGEGEGDATAATGSSSW
jgi:hypothetical protein